MKFLFVNMTSCSISLAPIPERHAGLGGRWLTSDDLDAIARLDFLCDDIGLDTMNTGVALAVAMDAGIIPFGDTQAAIETVASVAEGTKMGRLVGHGPDAVGKHLGHSRVPTVIGQSIAGCVRWPCLTERPLPSNINPVNSTRWVK